MNTLRSVVLLLILPVACSRQRDGETVRVESADTLLTQARRYVTTGEYHKAIDVYQKLLTVRPNDTDVYFLLGNLLTQVGDYDRAIALYSRLIDLFPGLAEAYSNLGTAHALRAFTTGIVTFQTGQKDLTQAIEVYHQAIKLLPDRAVFHYNLAEAYARQDRIDEAITEYETTLRLDPQFVKAYGGLGSVLEKRGMIDRVIGVYRQGIDRSAPDRDELLTKVGRLLSQKGDYRGAITAYQEAIRINPKMAEAHYGLGSAYLRIGMKTEGERELTVFKQLEAQDNSMKTLKAAAQREPRNPLHHFRLGEAYTELGRYEEAIDEYRRAVALDPTSPDLCNKLAGAYLAKGDLEHALMTVERAVTLAPDRADLQHNAGLIYARSGRYREAEDRLMTAIRLSPRYARAYATLGRVYVVWGQSAKSREEEAEKRKRAVEMFERAVALAPEDTSLGRELRKIEEKK